MQEKFVKLRIWCYGCLSCTDISRSPLRVSTIKTEKIDKYRAQVKKVAQRIIWKAWNTDAIRGQIRMVRALS
jgi:hypothetical protein